LNIEHSIIHETKHNTSKSHRTSPTPDINKH